MCFSVIERFQNALEIVSIVCDVIFYLCAMLGMLNLWFNKKDFFLRSTYLSVLFVFLKSEVCHIEYQFFVKDKHVENLHGSCFLSSNLNLRAVKTFAYNTNNFLILKRKMNRHF